MQVMYLGRAPRTKETQPDFLKWHRVTRRPLIFRGLTGSQRTPGFWGVTVTLFLSFHTAQRRLNKAAFHSFLASFLIGKVDLYCYVGYGLLL